MANPPIFFPVFYGDVDTVRALIRSDPGVLQARDAKNLTPLHVAAARGRTAVAQVLLDSGADVHGPTPSGQWTPLVWAAYRGHLSAVQLLLSRGADSTESGGNPIHYAGQRKHKEICRTLVCHGAIDPLVLSEDPDVLSLFRAAYSYDHESASGLLARRQELVNATDRDGRTPLHEAATQGDVRMIRVLLVHGADPTRVDRFGSTALDRARSHRQKSVVRLLSR